MPKRVLVALKVLVHIACLAPVAWLLVHLFQNNLGAGPYPYGDVFYRARHAAAAGDFAGDYSGEAADSEAGMADSVSPDAGALCVFLRLPAFDDLPLALCRVQLGGHC